MIQGKWIRKSTNSLNIIFIHGITSSDECWRNANGTYWPDLLKDENELAHVGIYLFSYRTGFNTGSYSLSDIVDSLKEYFKLDNLMNSSGIIFVCHSMGGIVARRFLVNQQLELIKKGLKKVGLFLVASPSLGSEYANMLGVISNIMGHTQANALKFSQNNVWLNDLDKDFKNLKENRSLEIEGKELIEDLPIFGKGIVRKQIVEPFSGAVYFGNPFKVPGSDHITIAKPDNKDAIQHRLLIQFIKEFINKFFLRAEDETKNEMLKVSDRNVDINANALLDVKGHKTGIEILLQNKSNQELFVEQVYLFSRQKKRGKMYGFPPPTYLYTLDLELEKMSNDIIKVSGIAREPQDMFGRITTGNIIDAPYHQEAFVSFPLYLTFNPSSKDLIRFLLNKLVVTEESEVVQEPRFSLNDKYKADNTESVFLKQCNGYGTWIALETNIEKPLLVSISNFSLLEFFDLDAD